MTPLPVVRKLGAHTRTLLAGVTIAASALGLAACGDSVAPTSVAPTVVKHEVLPAVAKKIPLKTTIAAVRAKIGPPQTIEHRVGEARKTKKGKPFSVPYVLYTYGVKGGVPSDSIEMTFVKGKLASVLMSIASKRGASTPKLPGVP